MGILNITPDSFSDGGLYRYASEALVRALEMMEEGVDIIDLGAESTRPGAQPVSEAEELDRLIPVIEALKDLPVRLSIDTRKASVMKALLPYGISMINDVMALRGEGSLEAALQSSADICLMHMRGQPQDMQKAPQYEDVVKEVYQFLEQRLFACEARGISRQRIIIDPGFCFGKTLSHNLQLLSQLHLFKRLGCRMMVGVSRKSMLSAITNRAHPALAASGLTVAILSLLQGADIIRTHDVAGTRDALAVLAALKEEVAYDTAF
jgi:dihydropteroate synthase